MKAYVKEQVRILRDFGITVSSEEIAHMEELPTDTAVSNYVTSLRKKRSDNWDTWYKGDKTSIY